MPHPDAHTLGAVSARHASERPTQVAVVCEDRELTYAELHRESNRVAHGIHAAGLTRGDRVAYIGKDSEYFFQVLFGCAKSETVFVPINWRLAADEVRHILHDSGSALVFCDPDTFPAITQMWPEGADQPPVISVSTATGVSEFAKWKAEQPDTDLDVTAGRDDPLAQLYTSGTTGRPKGVVLAHRSLFAVRDIQIRHDLDWLAWRPDDVTLICVPAFHVGGLWGSVQPLLAGATTIVMPVFAAQYAMALIQKYRVTIAGMVPAMLQTVLAEAGATREVFRTLRKVLYGGSPIAESLLRRCMDVMDADFSQLYGLTETGNVAVCLAPEDHRHGGARLKAAGRPFPEIDVKIIDREGQPLPPGEVGEVCLRTPARMVAYWKQPEATAEVLVDGWIHTGDAGYLDEDGYLFISDRIKDMIIVAGQNVYPAEVESVLSQHLAVREAAVVGAPDDRWGEAVHAFVVPRAGQQPKPREITLFLRGKIADYKLPTRFSFVDTLPRNASGKVLRTHLRNELWQGRDRKV